MLKQIKWDKWENGEKIGKQKGHLCHILCASMIPDYRNDWSLYRETWRWAALLILRRTYFRIHRGLSVASCASSKDTQPHALSSNTGTRLISSGEEATVAIAENEIRITAHRCASMARINGGRIRRSHLNDS